MSQLHAIVSFVPSSNCFVNLPFKWTQYLSEQNQLPQNVILELSWHDAKAVQGKAYVGWSGLPSKADHSDTIEIDPQFGEAIGLHHGQKIYIKSFEDILPETNSVEVEPISSDDWEIIERNSRYLEDSFIRQQRVVYPNEVIVLWVNSNVTRIKIVNINSKGPCAKLSESTEIVVAPKSRKPKNSAESKDITSNNIFNTRVYCLRVLPQAFLSSDLLQPSANDFCIVYIHPTDFTRIGLPNPKIVRVSKIQPSHQNKETEDKSDNDGKNHSLPALYVKVLVKDRVVPGHVILCESIMDALDVQKFDIIRLVPSYSHSTSLTHIIIRCISHPFQSASLKLHSNSSSTPVDRSVVSTITNSVNAWIEKLSASSDIVLTNGMKLSLSSANNDINVVVLFGGKPVSQNDGRHGKNDTLEMYAIVSKNHLNNNVKIEIGDNISYPDHKLLKQHNNGYLPLLAGVEKLSQRLQEYLRYCLGKADLRNVLHIPASYLERDLNTLACKLSLTSASLGIDLTICSFCTDCSVIKCTELSEDRISSVREKLQTCFDDAAWHAPSILLFDDLDRLIPAEVEHVDSFRFRQLAECFFHIASKMLKRHRITILATAQQKSSIHSFLTTSHLFSEIAQLNPPTKTERCEILKAIMSCGPELANKSVSNIDLLSVASECEGYLAADLKTLVERTIHEGAVRNLQNNIDEADFLLVQDDFREAQRGFIPFSLRGVKLHTSDVSWTDIGGLEETRKVLLETLEWPTKYASIFANCPLRLRSGLLLYGFPGCGKTLLASAVAKECGLNFISVKGPELLNKYIGASEKSVRDLFERAQAAKPCALFFDEFDSIAPKRGHDSTGVTDRVVNQMLTQMDGAEGLDGVYVLAATSRPDLIDPALLRPGRLDKSLFCNMPTLQERTEILKALARKLDLNDDVDLSYYANKCQGYSGADLQALLYNAHLEAIHETIDSEKFLEKKTPSTNGRDMQFVCFSASSKDSTTLTAAERSQLTERLGLIKKVLSPEKAVDEGNDKKQNRRSAIITNKHMQGSLKITRPSITPQEYARLASIYEEFITGRNGEMPSGTASHEIGQRSTLC
ncbi:3353_t:CDS:10 [Cetraspora pellucida]|uniref:Peroxisomal ATPase PEX1 n=1 Tax=Cetraspora pellucida TaxID=1433469 RepID=A0A9N9EYU7_9GLOM|nr:3353_t:CDS:10 [Cetraspora pellucida]